MEIIDSSTKYKSSKINMELFMWDLMEQCAHIYYICGAYWTFVHQWIKIDGVCIDFCALET
jgi:hypothetical protein